MLGTRGLPATHGGVERAVEELSVRLAARGCDVTVYCRPAYCAHREQSYRGVRLRYLPGGAEQAPRSGEPQLHGGVLGGLGPL